LVSKGQVSRAVLKLFPKDLKDRYTNEVDSYRFLNHYGVSEKGTIPRIFGVFPSINARKLNALLKDSIPIDATVSLPASAVVMEYVDGERPTESNLTPILADRILDALRDIHRAHVLHGDTNPRNIIISPETGRVVWINFSSADINSDIVFAISEYALVQAMLYVEIV
jgi:serine/threonine protein kinase